MITISEKEYLEHVECDDGLCLNCFSWSEGGCEPDAENYSCEACEEEMVCGAEQALIMGRIDFTD